MEYHPEMIGDKNNVRYALVQKGKEKTLYVIGLNPSTADDTRKDPTMTRVLKFAENNGFDGYVMLNLYPQRSTSPDNMDKKVNEDFYQKNLLYIEDFLSKEDTPVVLLCYGTKIHTRDYLYDSLAKIKEIGKKYNVQWKCIGITKGGDPKHPSRAGYGVFIDYDL